MGWDRKKCQSYNGVGQFPEIGSIKISNVRNFNKTH